MGNRDLDLVDRRILAELQSDGSLTNQELARRINLSPSPTLRRVQRLEEEGVILGYAATLDRELAGWPVTVFARLRLERQTSEVITTFEREVAGLPEVLECHALVGDVDYLLQIVARSLDHYREWYIEHLAPIPGVANIVSQVLFKAVKTTTVLPV